MSRRELETNAGKVTIAALLSLIGVMTLAFLFNIDLTSDRGGVYVEKALAGTTTATTTVTVINLPPSFDRDVLELYESSTTSPTNVGSSTIWYTQATDSNGEAYYLIICKTNVPPTPGTGGAAPTCNGGASNQWAVSPAIASGAFAYATRTALIGDVESNSWYGWICDSNPGDDTACNESYRIGTSTTASSSPFVVNHAPTFTVFSDDSPTLPGDLVTWTSTATDTDAIRGGDVLTLHVCRTAGFTLTPTPSCTGATWGTTTVFTQLGNPTATATIPIPFPDADDYESYGYIVDEFGLAASGGEQGNDSVLEVANATPSVPAGQIDLGSSSILVLSVEAGETPGLLLNFDVDDNNSCQNDAAGDEITNYSVSIHRAGIGSSTCDIDSDYDPVDCYPQDVGASVWNLSCAQNDATCQGTSDTSVEWNCTFPLWFLAAATDGGSLYDVDEWTATIQAIDDDFATSTHSTGSSGEDVQQFLAFNVVGSPIAYGSLQPGANTGTLAATSGIQATGNVGLDEEVLGEDMCVTYPTCSGDPSDTIFVTEQQFSATSSVNYDDFPGGAITLTTSSSSRLHIDLATTTATSVFSTGITYWGIEVPAAITYSGDYLGVNTIFGLTANLGDW